ncbi:protein disulfide-isomerase 5-2-like [Neltuma alba]|uniref:protein disulfide-isomerase 5-2-like n=1 Tax=Neltuma alba TaxID=207710 RepID=UPI0010A2ACFA|nr:protein disulfide-isomerase 5-2-like [Prosopis alba]
MSFLQTLDAAAPVLAALKEPIVIAKVDADKFTRLAKKYDVNAYPSLMLFIHGVPTDYRGPRKADLLVHYLKKFAAPDVTILDSDSAINNFIEAAGTLFPIFIGFGLSSSMIEKSAFKYKKNAWFSVAKDFSEDVMGSHHFDKVPALVSINRDYNEWSTLYGPFEEKSLEDFVKQNLIPLVAPVSFDTLKLMESDGRRIVLTIFGDEDEERSKKFIKLLKAAASTNRDLIFGYVGVKRLEDFAEKFNLNKLPKMVVWDGSDDYLSVIGSESIDEVDQATQISKFLGGYREGRTTQRRLGGPSLLRAMKKSSAIRILYVFIAVIAILMLLLIFYKGEDDEYQRVLGEEQVDHASCSALEAESKEYKPEDKED